DVELRRVFDPSQRHGIHRVIHAQPRRWIAAGGPPPTASPAIRTAEIQAALARHAVEVHRVRQARVHFYLAEGNLVRERPILDRLSDLVAQQGATLKPRARPAAE